MRMSHIWGEDLVVFQEGVQSCPLSDATGGLQDTEKERVLRQNF